MIDEKCGNVKPEEILTCAKKHADECGEYFENSDGKHIATMN